MKRRAITDFIDIHSGETAWVFGKGATLREFIDANEMSNAGALRVAINDVVAQIPDCAYCFANDHVNSTKSDWSDLYLATQTLFQPARTFNDVDVCETPDVECDICVFSDKADVKRLQWTQQRLAADGIAIREGTLGSALQILHIMGVKKIITVGIDGDQSHASGIDWRTTLKPDHAQIYSRIKRCFIEDAFSLGIDVEIFGSSQTHTQIMKNAKIRILKATASKGCHFAQNEFVSDISKEDAALLVQLGRAQYVTADEIKKKKPRRSKKVENSESKTTAESETPEDSAK